jgi:two-component system, NtrC family, nitrogen regulation sensor histidine kinase NtrY
VADEGPGIANTANLFVPFFTTKAGGVGDRAGPVEADRGGAPGSLALENRKDGNGTRARLRPPLRKTRT